MGHQPRHRWKYSPAISIDVIKLTALSKAYPWLKPECQTCHVRIKINKTFRLGTPKNTAQTDFIYTYTCPLLSKCKIYLTI